MYATAMKDMNAPPKNYPESVLVDSAYSVVLTIAFVKDSIAFWSVLSRSQTVPIIIAKPVYIATRIPYATTSR